MKDVGAGRPGRTAGCGRGRWFDGLRIAALLGKPPRFPGLSTTGPQDDRTTVFPPRNPLVTGRDLLS